LLISRYFLFSHFARRQATQARIAKQGPNDADRPVLHMAPRVRVSDRVDPREVSGPSGQADDDERTNDGDARTDHVAPGWLLAFHDPQPYERRGDVDATVRGVGSSRKSGIDTRQCNCKPDQADDAEGSTAADAPRRSHSQKVKQPRISRIAAIVKATRF
jgi:hypothetical protein